jgi:hypothetical protein
MSAVAERKAQDVVVASRVRGLSNDALIIELIQTLNHLSRWLTPIHDRTRLEVSARRSEPSVKEILIDLRANEAKVFSFMNAIAAETNPDLDRIPRVEPTPLQVRTDRESNALVIMSGFRRIRESSTALLRALPDNAWERGGYSRTHRDWTIRLLAESLATTDWEKLRLIDAILSAIGARQGIAAVSRVNLEEIDEPYKGQIGRG